MPPSTPVPVVLSGAADASIQLRLGSYGAAAKHINDTVFKGAKVIDTSGIRRAIEGSRTLYGWRIRLDKDAGAGAGASGSMPTDPLTFVFGPEAAEVFRGKTVRVTPDRRVSVYDVIRVVSGVENPRQTWDGICQTHHEVVSKTINFQFAGQGQRATPVTDIEGMLYIINLLPGANAATFRAGGARLLVRFLGGDERLIDEVQAIRDAHASGATQGTISQLFHEAAAQAPAPALPSPTHRFQFMSPRMAGRDMHEFVGKEVCYLLTFMHADAVHIKFGYTSDAHKRMTEHMREIPGCAIWCMLESVNARRVEDDFRKKMLYKGHLTEATVKGKKQTELLSGISAEDAELILIQLNDACSHNDDECLAVKLAKLEAQKQAQQQRFELIKLYVEKYGGDLAPEAFIQLLSKL